MISRTHTYSHAHTHDLTHTHILSRTHTYSHAHTHTLTHTHILSRTHTYQRMLGSLPHAYAYWKGVHCSLLYPVIHPQKPGQVMAVIHLANKTDALRRGFGVSLIHHVCVYANLLCGSVAGEYSQDAHYPSSSLSRSSISCLHLTHIIVLRYLVHTQTTLTWQESSLVSPSWHTR